jgi:hypothetical protein
MANRFWVGGTGNWDATTTHWSATSGGAAGASVPILTDDVYFDANSGGGTVTVNLAARTCLNLSFRGLSGTSDFTGTFAGASTLNISGGLILSASTTYTYSSTISFLATSGSYNITSNGRSLSCTININALGATFNLTDGLTTLTSAGTLILTAGTLNFGSSTHNIFSFSSSNSNVRTIDFGTATVNLTGNNVTIWTTSTTTNLTVLGTTPTINGTYSGSVGTRTITVGLPTEANSISINVSSGSDIINISAANIKTLNFTGFSGSTIIGSSTIYKDLAFFASQSFISVGSLTFAGTSVTQTITSNNLSIPTASLTINSATTTFQTLTSLTITGSITLTNGTFSVINGANITCSSFISNNSNTRTLNMGSGVWTLTGTLVIWNITTSTGMTLNCETSRVVITDTSATAVTFTGGGLTYYTIEYARGGGGGSLIFNSINTTIVNFIDVTSTAAHNLTFNAAGTFYFYRFIVKGSAGQLITVGRGGAISFTLSKLGRGIVSNCDYLTIVPTGFTVTPASTWYAGANSTGSGTGWTITNAPSSQSLLGTGGVG